MKKPVLFKCSPLIKIDTIVQSTATASIATPCYEKNKVAIKSSGRNMKARTKAKIFRFVQIKSLNAISHSFLIIDFFQCDHTIITKKEH